MFVDCLKTIPHYLMPQHLLSRAVGKLAASTQPRLKNLLIKQFIKKFAVNMQEAEHEASSAYASFNDFFIRPLKADARQICQQKQSIVSPVDGAISQIGAIDDTKLLQAKQHTFTLLELLGGDAQAAESFRGGKFATIYLAPKDYHRVHMPYAGTLTDMIYVPGKLFSVQPLTVRTVPNLFARNERVICLFDTEIGRMAVIFVGAVIVASISTQWHGVVTPPHQKRVQRWSYPNAETPKHSFAKGAEIGHFKLGSTAIVLFANPQLQWSADWQSNRSIQLGQVLGKWI